MSENSRLPVRVARQPVGLLGRSQATPRGASFRYLDDVDEHAALSLIMPVRWDAYEWADGIHPLFQMNMPEGLLRAELINMFRKAIKGFDDFDLLGIVGPHQLGRLRVGHLDADEQPDISIDDLLLHDSAQGFFEDLLQRYARFSGVSGVQPKVLVRDNALAELDRFTHRGATHIVKSWREEDYPDLAANEYFCMQAARYSGLTVPNLHLSTSGKLLVVERFDVAAKGYLGFEDLCVLNGWAPGKKYDGSYEGCAKQLKTFLAPDRLRQGLEALFLNVALCTGVRNGDAHLKNFGVLYQDCYEGADAWLAPAYDIVSTTPYKPNDIMALLLAGSKNWPKHKLLADFGRRSCGLTELRCRELLEQVTDGMSKARGELSNYIQEHARFSDIGSRMLAEWDKGIARSLMADNRPKVVDLNS